jgi:hypothetical protein
MPDARHTDRHRPLRGVGDNTQSLSHFANASPCAEGSRHVDDDRSTAPASGLDDGVARSVWRSPYGAIVIEVSGNDVYVNGDLVEPHRP